MIGYSRYKRRSLEVSTPVFKFSGIQLFVIICSKILLSRKCTEQTIFYKKQMSNGFNNFITKVFYRLGWVKYSVILAARRIKRKSKSII